SRGWRSRADRSLSWEPDDAVLHLDETVTGERVDRLCVELRQRLFRRCDEAQRAGAPLAERAFEPRLLPQRLRAAPARRTASGERTDPAARDAREADGRPEIHQRLAGGGGEVMSRALLNASDIRVDGEGGAAEGKARHRCGGVRTDSRQLRQVLRPAVLGDVLRRTVQVDAPAG